MNISSSYELNSPVWWIEDLAITCSNCGFPIKGTQRFVRTGVVVSYQYSRSITSYAETGEFFTTENIQYIVVPDGGDRYNARTKLESELYASEELATLDL